MFKLLDLHPMMPKFKIGLLTKLQGYKSWDIKVMGK
jgi:hypothetical protein